MTSRANPEHWSRLCKVMGREELINDPRFATPRERVKNNAELDAIIREWTMTRTKHEAMEQVGSAGIPAGAVFDTMELMNDPNFEERGIMQVMQHPSYKPFKMPAWPVRVDGKPPRVTASPMLGQHTDEVHDDLARLERGGGKGAARRRRRVVPTHHRPAHHYGRVVPWLIGFDRLKVMGTRRQTALSSGMLFHPHGRACPGHP